MVNNAYIMGIRMAMMIIVMMIMAMMILMINHQWYL